MLFGKGFLLQDNIVVGGGTTSLNSILFDDIHFTQDKGGQVEPAGFLDLGFKLKEV